MPSLDLKTGTDNHGVRLVGGIALVCGTAFIYWALRGFLQYRAGLDLASADPYICSFGLLAGSWMLLMARRIFRRAESPNSQLLTSAELLIASLAAIAASTWFISIDLNPLQSLAFTAIGIFGLVLWHRRRRPSPTRGPRG
jgi:hypothetical protein